jgi:hypothetical protein
MQTNDKAAHEALMEAENQVKYLFMHILPNQSILPANFEELTICQTKEKQEKIAEIKRLTHEKSKV